MSDLDGMTKDEQRIYLAHGNIPLGDPLYVKAPNFVMEYSAWFDENNTNWNANPSYILWFLQSIQDCANIKLQSRGHIFLNEVYDMLGLPRTSAGALVGWMRVCKEGAGVKEQECIDRHHINFGIFAKHNDGAVYGYRQKIFLDFNVEGVIWNLI